MINIEGYQYEYKKQYQYLTNICLNITDACNLKCKYCFVEQHPHFITLETALKTVDWLHNNLIIKKKNKLCDDNAKCSLSFFGGEPTLLFDEIIVPVVNYINKNYQNDFQFGITTNGTLLDERKIAWLSNNKIAILLSIDGSKYTQNYNRPCQDETKNSFELVSKNIPIILRYQPNITFRSTIYQDTVSYMFENYIFAEQCGFKNIHMVPNEREKWTDENINILKEQTQKIYCYILNQFLSNNFPKLYFQNMEDSYKLLINQDQLSLLADKSTIFNRHCERCGLGTGLGSVNYEGKIYMCQEQDSRNTGIDFCIGDIYTGIDKEKHNNFLQKYSVIDSCKCEDEKLCENCKIKLVCEQKYCVSTSYDLFHNLTTCSKIHCIYEQCLIDNCILLMNILVNNNNYLFKQYLNGKCEYNKWTKKEV